MADKPESEMTYEEWLAQLPEDPGDGPLLTEEEMLATFPLSTRQALTDRRPRDGLGFLLPTPARGEQKPSPPASAEAHVTAPDYVTLNQMAAAVNRSKRTLEKALHRKVGPLPAPDIRGRGGKPNEWKWASVRPWLENEFGRQLPPVYFAHRS